MKKFQPPRQEVGNADFLKVDIVSGLGSRLPVFLERNLHQVADSAVFLLFQMRVDTINEMRLIDFGKGTEDSIPDRKYITVIGIGVGKSVMVMYVMHIGCDNHQAQDSVKLFGQPYVGMVKLGQEYRKGLIGKDNPHWRSGNYRRQDGKNKAENTFPRMVPVGGRGIDMRIAMVNDMKFPHPLHLMLYKMDQPGSYEVEQQQPYHEFNPKRPAGEPLKYPEMGAGGPLTRPYQQKGQDEIDKNSGEGEEYINSCMPELVV